MRKNLYRYLKEAACWLDIYFSGKAPDFTPQMLIKTTPFRQAVWEVLLTIPYGRTMTYGEIADRIAKQEGLSKMSAQAVGGAVRAQSDFADHPLPPRCRHKGQSDRLCGRY